MVVTRRATLLACTGIFLLGTPSALAQPGGGGGGGGGGPGAEQADSEDLTEECDTSGSSADYTEELSGTGAAMERNTASMTGCPNHVNWNINPNAARGGSTLCGEEGMANVAICASLNRVLKFISSAETIPAYPMLIASEGTTDLSTAAGAVGIMLNGVSAFSSWARDAATSYEEAAFYLEGDTFDLCGGHATSEGWYHYHNTAGCLQEQAMAAAGTTSDEHSPQLGWSYDGFPLYGQLGPDGVEMLLCGQEDAHESYCLDLCSGYEGELSGVDDYTYRYYSSCGFDEAFFPFTTNCYRGCCPTAMTCAGFVEECGTSATDGYTENYVPSMGTSLAGVYESELIDGEDTDQIGTLNSLDCSLYLGSASGSLDTAGAEVVRSITSAGSFTLATCVATASVAFMWVV